MVEQPFTNLVLQVVLEWNRSSKLVVKTNDLLELKLNDIFQNYVYRLLWKSCFCCWWVAFKKSLDIFELLAF